MLSSLLKNELLQVIYSLALEKFEYAQIRTDYSKMFSLPVAYVANRSVLSFPIWRTPVARF